MLTAGHWDLQVMQCSGSVYSLAWCPPQPLLVAGLEAQVSLYAVRPGPSTRDPGHLVTQPCLAMPSPCVLRAARCSAQRLIQQNQAVHHQGAARGILLVTTSMRRVAPAP